MIIHNFDVNLLSIKDEKNFLINCKLNYSLSQNSSKLLSVCIDNLEGITLEPLQRKCINELKLDDSVNEIRFIWKIKRIENKNNTISANIYLFSVKNEDKKLLLKHEIKKEI